MPNYQGNAAVHYTSQDELFYGVIEQYCHLAAQEKKVVFGGHLEEHKYYDMAPIVEKVLGMEIES